VEADADGGIMVVLDGASEARLWKALLIELVHEISCNVVGARFAGFWDLVTNTMHPASRQELGHWPA
jgi:hypothetical protein